VRGILRKFEMNSTQNLPTLLIMSFAFAGKHISPDASATTPPRQRLRGAMPRNEFFTMIDESQMLGRQRAEAAVSLRVAAKLLSVRLRRLCHDREGPRGARLPSTDVHIS